MQLLLLTQSSIGTAIRYGGKGATERRSRLPSELHNKETPVIKCNKGASSCTTGKKLFTLRVVQHGDRSPRAAGDSPSLEIFNISLDKALTNPL